MATSKTKIPLFKIIDNLSIYKNYKDLPKELLNLFTSSSLKWNITNIDDALLIFLNILNYYNCNYNPEKVLEFDHNFMQLCTNNSNISYDYFIYIFNELGKIINEDDYFIFTNEDFFETIFNHYVYINKNNPQKLLINHKQTEITEEVYDFYINAICRGLDPNIDIASLLAHISLLENCPKNSSIKDNFINTNNEKIKDIPLISIYATISQLPTYCMKKSDATYGAIYYMLSHEDGEHIRYIDSDFLDDLDNSCEEYTHLYNILKQFFIQCPYTDIQKFYRDDRIPLNTLHDFLGDNIIKCFYSDNLIDIKTVLGFVPYYIFEAKRNDNDVYLYIQNASLDELIYYFNNINRFSSNSLKKVVRQSLVNKQKELETNLHNGSLQLSTKELVSLRLNNFLSKESFETLNISEEDLILTLLSPDLSSNDIITSFNMGLITVTQLEQIYNHSDIDSTKKEQLKKYFSLDKIPEFLDNKEILSFYSSTILSSNEEERLSQENNILSSIVQRLKTPENYTSALITLYINGIIGDSSLSAIELSSNQLEQMYINQEISDDLFIKLYNLGKVDTSALIELEGNVLISAVKNGKLNDSALHLFNIDELSELMKTKQISFKNILNLYFGNFISSQDLKQLNIDDSNFIIEHFEDFSIELLSAFLNDGILTYDTIRQLYDAQKISKEEFGKIQEAYNLKTALDELKDLAYIENEANTEGDSRKNFY